MRIQFLVLRIHVHIDGGSTFWTLNTHDAKFCEALYACDVHMYFSDAKLVFNAKHVYSLIEAESLHTYRIVRIHTHQIMCILSHAE
jgi:hypothetical protein